MKGTDWPGRLGGSEGKLGAIVLGQPLDVALPKLGPGAATGRVIC